MPLQVDRDAVLATLAEADQLGRRQFLDKHHFGVATTYLIRHNGRFYDPKAVANVARNRSEGEDHEPAKELDGTQAVGLLEKLGFEIVSFSGLWWVNQSATYRDERAGGYVWAPQQTKAGHGVEHHTGVTKLRIGQRVIHYASGQIRAVGTVAEAPYEALRPIEFDTDAWGDQGFLCPVDYHHLETPIPLTEIPHRSAEAGPFDVNGKVKQGYLYRVHDDHALDMLNFLNERIPDFFDGTVTDPHLADKTEVPTIDTAVDDPILEALLAFKNVVLEGVPGTGKSFAIERVARQWKRRTGRDLLTFGDKSYRALVLHPSSSYEDFIEGLRPQVTGAELFDEPAESSTGFALKNGFFVSVCAAAAAAPTKDVLVLLDELNRCNVPSVFGDLLLTLEPSRRAIYKPAQPGSQPSARGWHTATPAQLPYSGRTFFVPDNVYVVATTNTTDRSVAPLDAALRRRFAFYRLEPDMPTAALLPSSVEQNARNLFVRSAEVLQGLNDHALRPCLGPDAMLGHSYLYTAATQLSRVTGTEAAIESLKMQWRYAILPQLVDAVRGLGAEELLDASTRDTWFAQHAELELTRATAELALTQLDEFLTHSLELSVVIEGTGLARGARITNRRTNSHLPNRLPVEIAVTHVRGMELS